MIRGDFPPSSRDTGFKLLVAAACIIRRPTSGDPVKLICKLSNLMLAILLFESRIRLIGKVIDDMLEHL